MHRTISFRTAVALASVTAVAALAPVFAQEEETAESVVPVAKAEKAFRALLRCTRAAGVVEILKPRSEGWVAAEVGRYYPLGSAIRVSGGETEPRAEFEFGEKALLVITNAAELLTREIEIGAQERVVELKSGRVMFSLPRTLKEGLFTVVAPAFCCENLAGDSRFDFAATGDGDEAVVRCVTGTMALKGSHYSIPKMGAANQVRVRTTGDRLFTSLRGESGDCKVLLEQGLFPEKNFETGETKDVVKTLEFSLSPQCAVKIFRAKSAVGGRVSVSMMTFSPSGEMLNRFAFSEGRSNVNSGELVISPKIPDAEKAKKDADEEDAEIVEAAPAAKNDADEEKAADSEEEKDDKKSEKNEEKKDDDI